MLHRRKKGFPSVLYSHITCFLLIAERQDDFEFIIHFPVYMCCQGLRSTRSLLDLCSYKVHGRQTGEQQPLSRAVVIVKNMVSWGRYTIHVPTSCCTTGMGSSESLDCGMSCGESKMHLREVCISQSVHQLGQALFSVVVKSKKV